MTLLPPSSSQLERDLERAILPRHDPAPIGSIWDADSCPVEVLPWLAWAVGVEDWSPDWPEERKRAAVAEAIPSRMIRGTLAAVRRSLEAVGYSDARVIEHGEVQRIWRESGGLTLEGDQELDGAYTLGSGELAIPGMTHHWAEWALDVEVLEGALRAEDQRMLREAAERHAPERSRLVALLYRIRAVLGARIKISDADLRVIQDLSDCRGLAVHRARMIRGCDRLDGEKRLDQGWATVGLAMRMHRRTGMAPRGRPAWRIGESAEEKLDGSWSLGEPIDGHRQLSGWPLSRGQLYRLWRPQLNGARRLGHETQERVASTAAHAILRDRRRIEEVAV